MCSQSCAARRVRSMATPHVRHILVEHSLSVLPHRFVRSRSTLHPLTNAGDYRLVRPREICTPTRRTLSGRCISATYHSIHGPSNWHREFFGCSWSRLPAQVAISRNPSHKKRYFPSFKNRFSPPAKIRRIAYHKGSAFNVGESQTWLRRRPMDLRSWKPASGWTPSIMYCRRADPSGRDGCCSSWPCMPAAPPASICLSPRPLLTRTRFRPPAAALSRAARRWSAGSRAWCAGTRWPWWSAPTRCRKASAATFPPSPPRPRCTKSPSITFCTRSTEDGDRDIVYFQGHAAPGIYARAFLEGRIPEEKLENFRRELKPGGGLSSYPHPWLMPDFWEFPTVSMGLGPIQAIYHARFIKYLENRGLKTVHRRQSLGLPRRRRNGRARIAGLDHAGLAREARQPDLRHQLQPAAARRSGARQRQDHPGTGSHLPRRRLERHQGDLGQRLGHA